jgi:phosphopantothenoylcysteine decarboxylase/phosphopantothenoylcysteine decarboxylase/phosphopantothenate--cysteine ligase
MTKNATEFITPLTFETLTKNPVYTESFEKVSEYDVEHIGLSKSADILVIAPATANFIAKAAAGIADDLLTTVTLACAGLGKKIIVCPAMNTAMYEAKVTQRNIKTLEGDGYLFVEPREALLACGDLGKGALAELDIIIEAIKREI